MDFIAVVRGAYLSIVMLLCVFGAVVLLCAIIELVLDFVRPERVIRTDHLPPEEVRKSRRLFRTMLAVLLVLAGLVAWAAWRFVMLPVWSNFLEYIR